MAKEYKGCTLEILEVSMKFYELLNLFRKTLPIENKNQQDFISALLTLFIDDSVDEDPFYEDNILVSNKSTVTKVFNGKRKLPKKIADFVLSNNDDSKFIDKVSALSTDTLEEIKRELTDKGLHYTKPVSDDSFPYFLAGIFKAFLRAASNQKDEVELKDINTSNEEPRSINKRPVPIEISEYSSADNVIDIGNEQIKLPPGLDKPKTIQSKIEAPYIKALLEIYSERLNKQFSMTNVEELPLNCKKHLERQRAQFYSSESLARIARDTFSDGIEQFERLEQEAYDGIENTYHASYPSGKERLNNVQAKITSTTLGASKLSRIVGFITNETKKGLCHKLVNDNYIKSWVNIDDEDF